MRTAIIDNSTLTSVQRLLGDIVIKNKHTIDGDIQSFELLIQSILFYDELYYLNDYKDKFRDQRARKFSFLIGLDIEEDQHNLLLTETSRLCADIIPNIRKSKISDENFAPFFELLKMHNIFTWDLSSSVFYLTQKMLSNSNNSIDIDKYSKLNQIIFNELSDDTNKPKAKGAIIYDSKGEILSNKYNLFDKVGKIVDSEISTQTEQFFANLNWLAYRSIYYTLLTKEVGGSLILNPIRSSFQINYLSNITSSSDSVYKNIISALNKPTEQTLRAIHDISDPIIDTYQLPMFSVWLVNKTKNLDEALNLALHLKLTPEFITARERLTEIENLVDCGNNKKAIEQANKVRLDMLKIMERLCAKYYVSTPQGFAISPLISAYNLGATFSAGVLPNLPNLPGKISFLDKAKDFIPQKGFNSIYKSLVNDLICIGKLGQHHDLLTAQVKYHKDARYYNIKEEDKNFMNYKSWWKIPL